MLKKLLKYDLRYMFKLWWIGAVTVIGLAIIGGFCINNIMHPESYNTFFVVFSGIFLIPTVLGISAFSMYPLIVSFIRMYKNFFSDEGYLTFTLPVKLTTLINSKLISTVILNISSYFVVLLSIFLMIIGASNNFLEDIGEISYFFKDIFEYCGIYSLFYIVEIIAILILATVFSILFTFCCITFGCIITKKAKVIASIGIYYAVNSVVSFLSQIFITFVSPGIVACINDFPEGNTKLSVLLFGLVAITFIAIFCGLLYLLQYYMLERKLNLA
ncbi:MAG: hypothetical protein E7614_03345 [Ruminococcaceae bacterium]|nr:hypothetical protein [Oscillospiraceae bacterium]